MRVLAGLSDEFLARQVQAGDDAAFAELVRRYRPLLRAATRRRIEGLDADDAWQAALIGLYEACRHTDGMRHFAGMANNNVRWRVAHAARDARAGKHQLVTRAARAGEGPDGVLEWIACTSAAADPARVVELREELAERWRARQRHKREQHNRYQRERKRRLRAGRPDKRRRYSDEQIARTLALVADRGTVAAAAAAVGVPHYTVWRWLRRDSTAAQAVAQRRAQAPGGNLSRRFSDEQKQRALEIVANGGTVTAAAAAIGATHPTVLRWLRNAA